MSAKRDWGYAEDYVEAMWLMLQKEKPDDYVIATGEMHSVREFVELAATEFGFNIQWMGEGLNERGIDENSGRLLVEVSPKYFRPAEVDCLYGDSSKAREKLKWRPKTSFIELIKLMTRADLKNAEIQKSFGDNIIV